MHRVLACVAVLAAACARPIERPSPSAIDDAATFVAHRVHGGFAIDRLDAGTGEIRSVARLGSTGPTFEVRGDDGSRAALWVAAPATVTARPSAVPTTPPAVTIEPSWDAQAIRLTIRSPDGAWYRTDVLARVDGRSGSPVFRRGVDTTLDARGTFRADLRDPSGAAAGWIEVRVPSPDEPRLFQGVLPPSAPIIGAALTVALDSEIDWIEDHALDVYRGASGGRVPGGGPNR